MNIRILLATLLAFLLPLIAGPAPASELTSVWSASAGELPQDSCPPWQIFDNASPEAPSLSGESVLVSTDANAELMYFKQQGLQLEPGQVLVIEFGVRYVGGSSSTSSRTGVGLTFEIEGKQRNSLYIGRDLVFLLSDVNTRGSSASVDTGIGLGANRGSDP